MTVVSQSRFASRAEKNRSTQRGLAPAMLERLRPAAELLAVVAHRPEAVARLGGVVAQVADDVVDLAERDPVAEALLRAEDRQDLALVVGRVGTPERLLGDRGGAEVGVVEDRPAVAGGDRATSAGPAPRPARRARRRAAGAEPTLELVGHPDELADPVALRQGGEDGLVPAAADELDLAAGNEAGRAAPRKSGRSAREPIEEGTGVVEGERGRPDGARAPPASAGRRGRRSRR